MKATEYNTGQDRWTHGHPIMKNGSVLHSLHARARSELSGNVTTSTLPLTADERLRLYWRKRAMYLAEKHYLERNK